MKKCLTLIATLAVSLALPLFSQAQTAASGIAQMHVVLSQIYDQMIPLCSDLITVSQAIAGFGALFYIGYRVWKCIARAEPIDFFSLLRPFVLTLLIGMFPQVLAVLNSILQPTVTGTAALVDNTNAAVMNLITQQAQANGGDNPQPIVINPYTQGGENGAGQYSNPSATTTGGDDSGGFWSSIGSGLKFLMSGLYNNLKTIFAFFLSIVLQLLYYAASLCIDTIRTFHLIILAILGPFAFAFSCYDGLQHSLTHWLARYINIYLWLPIANIFGAILSKIQENMLQLDLSGGAVNFVATDITYLIFLVIGIIGYFTVPSIANYIIHTHGGNPLLDKVTGIARSTVQTVTTAATTAATGVPISTGGSGGGGFTSTAGYSDAKAAGANDSHAYSRKQIEG